MKTTIIFKKDVKNDNEIIAFMPYEVQNWQGDFMCYAHLGQHSLTNDAYFRECRTATLEEYKSLLNELINLGYDVEIKKRLNVDKFKKAYQEFLNDCRKLGGNKNAS